MRIRLDEATVPADAVALWPVHQEIFDDGSGFLAWRDDVWEHHRLRAGFRLVRAYEGDALIGFGYGNTGCAERWWTAGGRTVLPTALANAWLGGHFEVVSLGVRAGYRRRGAGRALLTALTAGLPHDRVLLVSAADPADPGRRLCLGEGWEPLGPGPGKHTEILGRRR